jgi:NTE family protein
VDELVSLWANLTVNEVFRTDLRSLAMNALRWVIQLGSGGVGRTTTVRGLVDTSPLRRFLGEALHAVDGEITGIQANLERGRLRALAISASSYSTGQSITWIQGSEIDEWQRPNRRARKVRITLDHVMASSALPIVFPAVKVGQGWYGDGGVRQSAPLSPALHLGADRILAISTRYARTREEARRPAVTGYPPPAQVAGVLMNSIFLDMLDQDAHRLRRINGLLRKLPPEERGGMRPIRLLTLRPSQDLGKLANEYEPQLPGGFRFLLRGLGTGETRSPDFLSLILFQPDYLRRLMEMGKKDAVAHGDRIRAFMESDDSQWEEHATPRELAG